MSDIALFAANILVGYTLSVCVLIVAYGRDRQLFLWSLIFSLHATAYALIALRGVIPDFVSIVVANTAISAMLALYVEGLCRLENQHPPRLLAWLPVLGTCLVYWIFIRNFDTRVFLGSLLYASQTLILTYTVLRGFKEREGRGKWILLGAVFIATAVLLYRGVIALVGDQSQALASGTSALPMVTSLSAIAVLIMFAFGLVVVFKERAEQETLELALRDPLTNLGNRRMLDNTLRHALRNSVRSKQFGALMLIDLDDFKPLNDTYGHSFGDQLLVEVAYRLRECVKADDAVVRLGGDEFVVLIRNLGTELRGAHENAHAVAQRILTEIAKPYKCLAFAVEGQQQDSIFHKCTCSIGLAFFVSNVVSKDKLMANADAAMYKAKDQGRDRVVLHEDYV